MTSPLSGPAVSGDGTGGDLGVAGAWEAVSLLARLSRRGTPVCGEITFPILAGAGPLESSTAGRRLTVRGDAHGASAWEVTGAITADARNVLDLCVPLCVGEQASELVVAHLGQSLDGRVTTPRGVSPWITGIEDVTHTHRLRALFDAVVVGRTTVEMDNPKLTTRLVSGDNPARVVLDPGARAPSDCALFHDGEAPTWVVTSASCASRFAGLSDGVRAIGVELDERGRLPLAAVLAELRKHGLRRIFVEGGGITVSRFLEAKLLHRLHITVAPKIIGTGAPALEVAAMPSFGNAVPSYRRFFLGGDVIFDCDFSGGGAEGSQPIGG